MRSFEQCARLVDLIYQASIGGEAWPDVLQEIQEGFAGCGVVLGVEAKGRPLFLEIAGDDREAMDRLGRQYARKSDVWGQSPVIAGGGGPPSQAMPDAMRGNDVFAPERGTTYDGTDCAIFPLLRGKDLTAFVIFARSYYRGAFDRETLDFLQNLAVHLQRAVQIQARLEQGRRAELALAMVERLEDAIMFVTSDGQVTFANQAAERLLGAKETGLALQDWRLRGRTHEANAALERLLADAFVGERIGGVVMLARNGRRPVAVYCAKLERDAECSFGREPAAVLLLADTASGMRTPAQLLRRLFGLSAAEARLAHRLANGDSLNAAAAAFGVAKSTVVSQLGGVFTKTQTRRQSELIGLLRDLPRLSV